MNYWDRVNLVLGIVVAVLASWWFLYRADPQPTYNTLTQLDPAAITTIRIERHRQLAIELRSDDGSWQLSHPFDAVANPRRVAQLAAIARAPVWQSLAIPGDADRYGLEMPTIILQLDNQRIAFGDRDPTQRGRYVSSGEEIHVIDDVFHQFLTLPARHYTSP